MDDVFATLLADLAYSGDWEGTVEMRTEHGWVDVLDRVTALRDELRAKVAALPHGSDYCISHDYAGNLVNSCECPLANVLDLLNGSST